MKIFKVKAGSYRTETIAGFFGYIKKVDSQWHAKIYTKDFELNRFAGVWNTRKEAIEEIETILARKMAGIS